MNKIVAEAADILSNAWSEAQVSPLHFSIRVQQILLFYKIRNLDPVMGAKLNSNTHLLDI